MITRGHFAFHFFSFFFKVNIEILGNCIFFNFPKLREFEVKPGGSFESTSSIRLAAPVWFASPSREKKFRHTCGWTAAKVTAVLQIKCIKLSWKLRGNIIYYIWSCSFLWISGTRSWKCYYYSCASQIIVSLKWSGDLLGIMSAPYRKKNILITLDWHLFKSLTFYQGDVVETMTL